jgi:hypothetical protein
MSEWYADGLLLLIVAEPTVLFNEFHTWTLLCSNYSQCCCSLMLRIRVLISLRRLSCSCQQLWRRLTAIGYRLRCQYFRIGCHIRHAPSIDFSKLLSSQCFVLYLYRTNRIRLWNWWYNAIETAEYSWNLQSVIAPSPCRFLRSIKPPLCCTLLWQSIHNRMWQVINIERDDRLTYVMALLSAWVR